jgi:photosystem II stability/assembly factor-like uncharacterized protein
MAHHFVAGEGSLWAQIDGPNTIPVYLGCHEIGDIDIPKGDIELIYCPDASGPSRFEVVGSITGAAGAITTTVTTDVTDALDSLEQVNCPFTLFVNMSKSGRKDLFTNFDRTFVLSQATITSEGLTGLTTRTPDDNTRAEQTFDISGEALLRLFEQDIARQTITETASINKVIFTNEQTCRTDDDPASDFCQTGFASTDAGTGSPSASAQVLITTNGSTWTAASADPFGAAEDITGIVGFELDRDSTRVIVARGTTDGANPAEIGYSDDSGATWTLVDVGAVNGEFVPTQHGMTSVDRNNTWLCTDGGYIYYSADAGLTWTAQESGSITATAWNAIEFVTDEIGWVGGASNAIARSIDGGASWSSITGPSAEAANAVISIAAIDKNRAWLGYDSGTMYYTIDAGVTWTQRSFTGSGVGEVRDIAFLNESLGYMLSDTAAPLGTVLWTIDGGYTWSTLTTPTNSGLNALALCNQWNFFVAGEANSGTGYIAKASVS